MTVPCPTGRKGLRVLAALAVWAAAAAPAAAIQLQPVATGLSFPVVISNAGDGSGRLFIVEQSGMIRIYDGNQLLPTPFLDITGLVSGGGERGLLGLAFHPNYPATPYFYVNYTCAPGTVACATEGDTVIARYQVSADPNVADPSSEVVLIALAQPEDNHNGGQLQFGPNDNDLYIALGDGGGAGDNHGTIGNGQDLTVLLGKILRIDVDTVQPPLNYGIPPDNPFVNSPPARPEIWAYGLRNPWRFSFDRATSSP
jgi:glucose/arabinose dehydrogenase